MTTPLIGRRYILVSKTLSCVKYNFKYVKYISTNSSVVIYIVNNACRNLRKIAQGFPLRTVKAKTEVFSFATEI